MHSIGFCLLLVGCTEALDTAEVTSEVRVCADGPTVEGIDVSKWQATIDWDAVATSDVRFAIIRTSHGLDYIDERYAFNWSEARRVGLLRGTYQYFAPAQDPIAQADLLLERMGPLQDGDLPPVLDVEEADGQSPEQIVAAIHAWSDHVEAALGIAPMIYTAKYFWQDGVGAPADFVHQPLWVANYGVDCPLIADPWTRWDFWQYTSTGSVAGIAGNVDRDVWNGTEDELIAWAWPPDQPPPDDPPPDDPPPDDPPPSGDDDPSGGCSSGGGDAGAGAGLLLLGCLLLSWYRRGSHAWGAPCAGYLHRRADRDDRHSAAR